MQIATQIIAQRATPATRTTTTSTTKTRWQPYIQPTASTSMLPTRSPYLHTPSPTQFQPGSEASTSRSCPPATPQTPKESLQSKQKYALGLIDQAVYTLADIWRPHDIPKAFLPPKVQGKQPLQTSNFVLTGTQQQHQASSSKSQPTLPHTSTNSQKNATPALIATGNDPDQNISSLKTFVHEVLKRSRTSATVLQTALCYLEGVRMKVPEILREESMGIRSYFQPDSMIQPATAAELAREAELAAIENSYDQSTADDSMKTIRVTDIGSEDVEGMEDIPSATSTSLEPQLALSSSTSLPSPLLCPRRAFLASLILASKFSQDKCYSNRAWAKLSGLPPREVGRCERALGQALDWRLWVGKSSPMSSTTTLPVRAVQKCHSEPSILSTPSSQVPQELSDKRVSVPTHQTSLRRCSTAPETTFSARVPVSVSACSTSNIGSSSSSSSSEDDLYIAQFPEAPKQEYPIPSSSTSETQRSPTPETPGLTYSPTSSVSSGDQTIQMSTFEDNNFSGLNVSQLWPEGSDPRIAVVPTPAGVVCENVHPVFVDNKKLSAIGYQTQHRISVVDPESVPYSEHYLWRPESSIISLEATSGGHY